MLIIAIIVNRGMNMIYILTIDFNVIVLGCTMGSRQLTKVKCFLFASVLCHLTNMTSRIVVCAALFQRFVINRV